MSGIDEQSTDVTPCGCEGFDFWIIGGYNMRLGFLNPNSWVESDFIKSVNRATRLKHLSKDEFINRITNFTCEDCRRDVKKGCDLFERLCLDVRRRWDIEGLKNPDDVM